MRLWLGPFAVLCTTACVPYTVGSMAQTAPVDEFEPAAMFYSAPLGLETLGGDSTTLRYLGLDGEVRWGLTDHSDAGIRLASVSGVIFNYKHRVTRAISRKSAAVAIMPGFGVVSFGQHVHFELTVIASAPQSKGFTPYGGVRAMKLVPLNISAGEDAATYGGFVGTRLGKADLGVSLEFGMFYDRPMLGAAPRAGNLVIVPAIVLHGQKLLSAIFGILRPRPY